MLKNKKILLIGAHPDDLEFGMGATMFGLDSVDVVVLSDTVNVNGEKIIGDFRASMDLYGFSHKMFREPQVMEFYNYEDKIKNILFKEKQEFKPDIVFCPSFRSHNLDHRYTAAYVKNVFQEQSVLMYEVIRGDYEHKPNVWSSISQNQLDIKLGALGKYTTQKSRPYMNAEAIIAMARFRGAQVGVPFAETFEAVRIVV